MVRRHYRGCIKEEITEEQIEKILTEDKKKVRNAIQQNKCWTVALYQHDNMLFLYYEALDETLLPQDLFEGLSQYLEIWPEKDGRTPWAYMYNIYYHAIPQSEEQWARKEKKIRRGRIAYLYPDKLFSYTYYHQAIVAEGLLEGDQYQSIALHENILFSYFEEPKHMTHIREDSKEPSRVIDDWIAVDPESHFDHTLSGKDNFLIIKEICSMGLEDYLE